MVVWYPPLVRSIGGEPIWPTTELFSPTPYLPHGLVQWRTANRAHVHRKRASHTKAIVWLPSAAAMSNNRSSGNRGSRRVIGFFSTFSHKFVFGDSSETD